MCNHFELQLYQQNQYKPWPTTGRRDRTRHQSSRDRSTDFVKMDQSMNRCIVKLVT